jgi:ribosomal subunit interface protein
VRVNITERHCEVPQRVRERTERQISGLSRYEPRATAAEVVYSDERHTRKVEVIVHIDGAEHVVGRGEAADFRSALDQVVNRLRRMLSERRDRRRDHQAPPLSDGVGVE